MSRSEMEWRGLYEQAAERLLIHRRSCGRRTRNSRRYSCRRRRRNQCGPAATRLARSKEPEAALMSFNACSDGTERNGTEGDDMKSAKRERVYDLLSLSSLSDRPGHFFSDSVCVGNEHAKPDACRCRRSRFSPFQLGAHKSSTGEK